MILSEFDPLTSDALELVTRMLRLGVGVKMDMIESLKHGCFNATNFVAQCTIALVKSSLRIRRQVPTTTGMQPIQRQRTLKHTDTRPQPENG